MQLPTEPIPGEEISAAWGIALIRYVRSITPQNSSDIVWSIEPGGARARVTSSVRSSSSQTATAFTPFQIYQFTPDPSVPASDWRNVRVHSGLINSIAPAGDDSDPTPTDILVPASTSLYKIWADCDVVTADGPTQGTITAVTLASGASGWSGFPAQPNGDSGTGAPPAKFYILLGRVTTSNDTLKTMTIFQDESTALQVDMEGFEIFCDGGSTKLRKRMTYKQA